MIANDRELLASRAAETRLAFNQRLPHNERFQSAELRTEPTGLLYFLPQKNYQSSDKKSEAIFALVGRTIMTSNVLEKNWNIRFL